MNGENNTQPEQSQPTPKKGGTGLQSNIAGALAYFLGPVTGILFLLIEKQNKFVRFHAMQSVLFFVALMVLFAANTALGIIPIVGVFSFVIGLLSPFAILVVWLVLMYKAFNNEEYELPVVGDIARKQIEKV